MRTSVADYLNVADRAAALGLTVPEGVSLLPVNFESAVTTSDFVYEEFAPWVRDAWREAGFSETMLHDYGCHVRFRVQEDATQIVALTIFVGASLLSQNPLAMSVALGVLSNFVTDWFRRIGQKSSVKLDIVVERSRGREYKRVTYEGDVSSLAELDKVVREVWRTGHGAERERK